MPHARSRACLHARTAVALVPTPRVRRTTTTTTTTRSAQHLQHITDVRAMTPQDLGGSDGADSGFRVDSPGAAAAPRRRSATGSVSNGTYHVGDHGAAGTSKDAGPLGLHTPEGASDSGVRVDTLRIG